MCFCPYFKNEIRWYGYYRFWWICALTIYTHIKRKNNVCNKFSNTADEQPTEWDSQMFSCMSITYYCPPRNINTCCHLFGCIVSVQNAHVVRSMNIFSCFVDEQISWQRANQSRQLAEPRHHYLLDTLMVPGGRRGENEKCQQLSAPCCLPEVEPWLELGYWNESFHLARWWSQSHVK